MHAYKIKYIYLKKHYSIFFRYGKEKWTFESKLT